MSRLYRETAGEVVGGGSSGAPVPGRVTRTLGLPIQRKAAPGAADVPDRDAGLGDLGGRGDDGGALPADLRGTFEESLGVDLGAVRVHTGDRSAAASTALGARAFTHGSDIHFGAGEYNPGDPFGQHLLAHEVAHAVQQRDAPAVIQRKPTSGESGDAAEAKADTAADAMVPGAAPTTKAAPKKDDAYLAHQFVNEFEPILAVFSELPKRPEGKKIDPTFLMANWDQFYQQNQKEVAWLEDCARKLKVIFSSRQLTLVSSFVETRIIPDGLFTDTKVTDQAAMGTVMSSSSQRTLMAAHILAKGRTVETHQGDSATAPGKVRAANCGQWNEYVWIYAAVNSSQGDPGGFQGSVKNSKGPTGKTSFGAGGQNQNPFGGHSGTETKKNLADANAAGVETLDAGGGPGRLDPLGAPDPVKMFATLKGLEPGDWVWIDNRADADGHSFIFAGWVTEPVGGSFVGADGKARPTARGVAKAYSQRSNGTTEEGRKKQGAWATDGGGDSHEQPLGYPYSATAPVRFPVTQVSRPAKDAGPARTEEQLLHYDRKAAIERNTKETKNNSIDLARYHAQMAKAAHARLDAATSYDEGLKELCAAVLKRREAEVSFETLSALIALVQRMSPTDEVLNKKKSGYSGRPVRGWLDPREASDLVLVPGGLASIAKPK